MSVGDSKSVTIPANQAYGARNPEMVQDVPRTAIPTDIDLQKGMILSARSPEGQNLNFKVVAFNDEKVTVDGNHPLAGEDLTFQLELVGITN
jgi:FKBP-type peptidyl-prolyl cis-trans isomerase 2